MIGVSIVISFAISAVSGLLKGIRIFSSINVVIFIIIYFLVFVTGPASFYYGQCIHGHQGLFKEFFPRSLSLGPFGDKDWMHLWTTFIWANWMAWAPITTLCHYL